MSKHLFSRSIAIAALLASTQVFAHGDVTPQAVDTHILPPIENMEEWLDANPYEGNKDAIEVGKNAFAQNCARCHGIDAVSGGIAPDLRELPLGEEGHDIFKERMTNGAVRNGITYMPKFWGLIDQKGLWAIRTYIEARNLEVTGEQ